MRICVAGLGIIGGSLCMALKRAGYAVDGWNRSSLPPEYALNNGIIDGIAEDFLSYDIVFVALPFKPTIDFINGNSFKNGAVVVDVCGVKKPIEAAICLKYRNFDYVGCHPMAGKEVSGIENACANLFDGASMVITHNKETNPNAVKIIKKLSAEIGFKYAVECSAEVHDRKIAYTSQLAHVVSNAYVKDKEIDCCLGFTGGSFQDMTRIAGVDENVWASLYLANAENLTGKISALINSLNEINTAVKRGDKEELVKVLAEGRVLFDSCKKVQSSSGISVTQLN